MDDSETIKNILKSTSSTRDALPYTAEFDTLHDTYIKTCGTIDKHDFWRKLSNAAKRGGWKGKNRGQSAPALTPQQLDAMRTLAAGKLGSRDSLAYSNDLDLIREKFNQATKLELDQHQVWRVLCNLGKKSLKPIVKDLLTQAIDSLVLGIEHFNRPSNRGRTASVLIMLDHAAEMLLKCALVDRGAAIRNPANGYTHSVEHCVNIAASGPEVAFLKDSEQKSILVLNGLRDQAQHFIVDVSEQILYLVAQRTVTVFADLLPRLFGKLLSDEVPMRVLPISVSPPKDIEILMDDEFAQLKNLVEAQKGDVNAVEPRLRSLVAIDNALKAERTQISDEDFEKTVADINEMDCWKDVFQGISKIDLTTDGSGVNVSIRISKKEGMPVRIANDGEEAKVIAVRKINDTEHYCFSSVELAKKIGLTGPKTRALVKHLDLQADLRYFKEMRIGQSVYKRYTGDALAVLKRELPKVDMDKVWQKNRTTPKQPR